MARLIKTFADNSKIEYNRGNFDNWCIYYIDRDKQKAAPKDTEYFAVVRDLAKKYGTNRIYDDFVQVYNMAGKNIEIEHLNSISAISKSYHEDELRVDVILSILYAGMVAEENVKNTKLGKRIKRLGMYLLLMESKTVTYAANVMRGKSWKDIDADCEARGF